MKLTPATTVAQAAKDFKETFGGLLRIKGDAGATLKSLGLKSDVELTTDMTVAQLIEQAKNAGLGVKVRTIDDWVAVIDSMPLGLIARIGKNSTKAKMQALVDEAPIAPAPAVPKAEPAPAAPKTAPAAKPAAAPKSNLITKEEMDELLNQIKALRETIAKLEIRIAKLEQAPATAGGNDAATSSKQNFKVFETYQASAYKPDETWRSYIEQKHHRCLYNGKAYSLSPITSSEGNWTVGQTRKVADMLGHKYDNKVKREELGWELVNKYGDGEWAFIGKYAVDSQGKTFDLRIEPSLVIVDNLSFITGKKEYERWGEFSGLYFTDLFEGEPFKDNPSWSDEERFIKMQEFIKKLKTKENVEGKK